MIMKTVKFFSFQAIRELKQITTATATGTSPNKRFNNNNNNNNFIYPAKMNQLVKKHAGIHTCAAIKYDMKYNK